MSHVRLEPERVGLVHTLQEVYHLAPGVHAGPADFPLGGEFFAVVLGDGGGLLEGLGDGGLVGLGVVVPVARARGGVDADDAVGTDTDLAKGPSDDA